MRFERTELLLGREGIEKLKNAHITVAGLGAVGSYTVEALARAGIGHLRIVDYDVVNTSNINRQLYALDSTVGHLKTESAEKRIRDINPDCKLEVMNTFIDEHSNPAILSEPIDVLIDAIDSLSAKIHLIYNAYRKNIHVISSMGAAGRRDANLVTTGDLSDTHTCPLARFVRIRLHRRGLYEGIRCIYSTEPPMKKTVRKESPEETIDGRRKAPVIGSLSYVTGIFGLKAAYEAIQYILDQ